MCTCGGWESSSAITLQKMPTYYFLKISFYFCVCVRKRGTQVSAHMQRLEEGSGSSELVLQACGYAQFIIQVSEPKPGSS